MKKSKKIKNKKNKNLKVYRLWNTLKVIINIIRYRLIIELLTSNQ